MTTPRAGATENDPTHDLTLSDGSSTVGLILVGPDGKHDPRAIQRNSYPRTSTKFSTGTSQYDDVELPYKKVIQDNFTGGRGADLLESDTSRFHDSYMANTQFEKQVINGPMAYHCNYFNEQSNFLFWPGTLFPSMSDTEYRWLPLYGSTRYRATAMGQTNVWPADKYEIIVNKVGTPGDLTIALYNNSGAPVTLLDSVTYAESTAPDGVTHHVVVDDATPYSFGIGPQYSIVVSGGASDDASNHWEVLGPGDALGWISSNASSWTYSNSQFYYRVSGKAWASESSIAKTVFFEYRRGFYAAVCNGTDTRVYIQGTRGAADSNSGALDRLKDSTQTSWGGGSLQSGIIVITAGPGSQEEVPWRRITGGGSGYLTVSPNWFTTHTTATEYVVMGQSDSWLLWHTFTNFVLSDVEVAGDWVFMASETSGLRYFREYNSSGTWSKEIHSSNTQASHLKSILTPGGLRLFGAQNLHPLYGKCVWSASIPPGSFLAEIYHDLGQIAPVDEPWTDLAPANITITKERQVMKIAIAGGFTTGLIAKHILDQPLDISKATGIAIYIESSVNTSSGDIKLILDDTTELGGTYLPSFLYLYNGEQNPNKTYFYDDSESAAADKWKAYPDIGRQSFEGGGKTGMGYMYFTLLVSDRVYIGLPVKFDRVRVDIDTANSNTATLTGEYWRGDGWQSASITDGTASSGKTLAQDGDITFTAPNDWQRGSDTTNDDYLDTSLFWLRLYPSSDLSAVKLRISLEHGLLRLIEDWRPLVNARDGRTNDIDVISLSTDDYIIVGFSERFDKIAIDMGATVNAVSATMSAVYFNGSVLAALTITDGTASSGKTLAQDGDITFTPPDDWQKMSIEGNEAYYVFLYPSSDLTEGIWITEISVKLDHELALAVTNLTANVPEWQVLTIYPTKNPPTPDYSRIRAVGLRLDTDLGAQTVRLHALNYVTSGGGQYAELPYKILPDQNWRITNLVGYGEPREFLYVFTENTFYHIDESDNLIPSPLGELQTLASEENGIAAAVNDVYLYFGLGPNLEQYHEGSMVDLGPNRDEGLPVERRGTIRQLVSLAGELLALVDPEDTSTNYWSILARSGGGWHEIYRSPMGSRIYDMYFQVLPGDTLSKLWFRMTKDAMYLPWQRASQNPLKDSNYKYSPEGHVITPWISAGFLDIAKLYKSLKMYTDNLGTNEVIKVDYQAETGALSSGWTEITDTFDTSPFQEIDMKSTNNLKARRIRLRFRLRTGDITETPILKAWVLEMLLRFEVKSVYSMTFLLADQPEDLTGIVDMTKLASADLTVLDGWSDTPTALTLRTGRKSFDDKTVIIEPLGLKPTLTTIYDDQGNAYEAYVADLTVLEL